MQFGLKEENEDQIIHYSSTKVEFVLMEVNKKMELMSSLMTYTVQLSNGVQLESLYFYQNF